VTPPTRAGGGEGFTVLEAAVALAVTGLALAAGYAGVSTLAEARRAGGEAHADVIRAANVRVSLSGWLRSTVLLLEARTDADGGHPRHEMSFVTADAGELRPAPVRVQLRVDLDPATPEQGLVAELTPLETGGGSRELLELAPRATGLEILYRVRREGRRRWTPRWEEGEGYPEAVRLRLLETAAIRLGPGPAPDRGERLPALLRRPLTVPLEAGRR
jgi:hypothetical protein